MSNRLEELYLERGMRMSEQRRAIIQVISEAQDHPCADEIYDRISAITPGVSIATVYRTLKIFADAGILCRLDFGDGRARYEPARTAHYHLIDAQTGAVIEFQNKEVEMLHELIARHLGYRLVGHRLELYGVRDGVPEAVDAAPFPTAGGAEA